MSIKTSLGTKKVDLLLIESTGRPIGKYAECSKTVYIITYSTRHSAIFQGDFAQKQS